MLSVKASVWFDVADTASVADAARAWFIQAEPMQH